MKFIDWEHCIILSLTCVLALALASCQGDDDPIDTIPQGMGRVTMRVVAKSPAPATRAETGRWLDPTESEEFIHDYKVVFVDGEGVVRELVEQNSVDNAKGVEEHEFQFQLATGNYTVYGFANLSAAQWSALGIAKGEKLPDLTTKKLDVTNGWTRNIPMTSRTGGQSITVRQGENQTFRVEVVRTLAKLQLDFENHSEQQMDIIGYEIYPLTTTNVSLLEPASPADIVTAETTSYKKDLSSSPIVLAEKKGEVPGKGSLWVYVNESNATATAIENQYSIRLRVKRHNTAGAEIVEYRYGFTVNRTTVVDGVSGFTHICRNDWIKIPIAFTDWQFRVEALPFPPIAGFQSRVETADALSITFNTGGYIFLRPMFRKNTDPEGSWRSFSDSSVKFVLPKEYDENNAAIDPETGTGLVMSGDMQIFTTKFYLMESGDIVGYLDNDGTKTGTVTVTVKVVLDGFLYQFSYNITKHA